MLPNRLASSALGQLRMEGVHIWLDGVRSPGEVASLAAERGVTGVTSAASDLVHRLGDPAYQGQLADLAVRRVGRAEAARRLYAFAARGICDALLPLYRASSDGGRGGSRGSSGAYRGASSGGGHRGRAADGLASVEIPPVRAAALGAEARALSWSVNRPNLLVQLPVSAETLPVVSDCLAEGIGVDATPVGSAAAYDELFAAFLDGWERAAAAGHDLSRIHAVATVPLVPYAETVGTLLGGSASATLACRLALANARRVFRAHELGLRGERWQALARAGAGPPRLLWRGTAMDGLAGPDTRFVDGLVAWGVISAMTPTTLDAVADHALLGGDTVTGRHISAGRELDALRGYGIRSGQPGEEVAKRCRERAAAAWQDLEDRLGLLLERMDS